jgi:hypothetical protein
MLRQARCHDHKFDPFKQTDYYRFLAVFEPLKRPLDGQKELDRLVGTEAELNAYRLATSKADEQVTPLRRQLDELKKNLTKQFLAKKASAPADTTWTDLAETVMAFRFPPTSAKKTESWSRSTKSAWTKKSATLPPAKSPAWGGRRRSQPSIPPAKSRLAPSSGTRKALPPGDALVGTRRSHAAQRWCSPGRR